VCEAARRLTHPFSSSLLWIEATPRTGGTCLERLIFDLLRFATRRVGRELRLIELLIQSRLAEQGLMSAALDDLALLDHENLIGALNS